MKIFEPYVEKQSKASNSYVHWLSLETDGIPFCNNLCSEAPHSEKVSAFLLAFLNLSLLMKKLLFLILKSS